MLIAIVSAMQEEISQINQLGDAVKSEQFAGREFFHWQTANIDFITAITQVGKVAAAQTISALTTRYQPDYVIVIGTAGALHPELNIGDIVISDKLFQHDVDLRPFRPRFELGVVGKTFFHADEFLAESLYQAAKNFLASVSFAKKGSELTSFGITLPKVYRGTITSGDVFFSVHYENYRQQLQVLMPEILATEMEGAAIAQVCDNLQIPFSVVRFISDRADSQAGIDFIQFITQIAAWYGKGIIKKFFRQLKPTAN